MAWQSTVRLVGSQFKDSWDRPSHTRDPREGKALQKMDGKSSDTDVFVVFVVVLFI